MTFTATLPRVEDVPATYSLRCDYCGAAAPDATTEPEAAINALRAGWKIRLNSYSPEAEFVGLADFIRGANTADCFCPSCLKREFE